MQNLRLKNKKGVDVVGGNVNAVMELFIGSFQKSTGDCLSTFYFDKTLNFADGGWGGGKSFVGPDQDGVFIHELGHALSLPHCGQGSYGASLPNDNNYFYPYGGEGSDGAGRAGNLFQGGHLLLH